MTTEYFKTAGPDVVSEEFDGDLVILKLTSGQYFSVNVAGADIWRSVVMGEGFGAGESEVTRAFLSKLVDMSLIVTDDKVGVPRQAPSDGNSPEIETYEDLADLIMADPIHDVTETESWPNLLETP